MSAETIPAEVRELAAHYKEVWINEAKTLDHVITLAILADRATRPTEPAAPVAEAGDGEMSRYIAKCREMSKGENGHTYTWWSRLADLLSTLEAERARAAAAEQRAADALARAEKAEDWQPIETAPMGKNGIAFMMLSFGPPGDQTVSEGMHFNGRFYAASVFYKVNPSDGRHFAFREHEVHPTHWRPTLAPPRASREAQPATDGGDNG